MLLGLNKKIWRRLLVLAIITTPLFGLLGGVPFHAFINNEIRLFLPFAFFIALITFLSWLVNILLLAAGEKIILFKKIVYRAAISISTCVILSIILFNTLRAYYPPPVQFAIKQQGNDTAAFEKKIPVPFLVTTDSAKMNALPDKFRFPAKPFFAFPQLVHSLTINLIILILSQLVVLQFRQQKIEAENAGLRQKNLEAKNIQLKNQLHPHFLFNSLNTLRMLLKKDADKAEAYLLKLSDILRVSTTSATNSVITVKEELALCLNYLQMQEVRFGDMLLFDVTNKKITDAQGNLPVFALQLLAENAIKHNAFTNAQPLHLFIDYDEARQQITVRNKMQPRRLQEVTTQTGLKNLAERYKLLCNQPVIIKNTGNEFAVTIKII